MTDNSTSWTSWWTLLKRECLRFVQVPVTTIVPALTTVLFYFMIFGLVIGSRIESISGIDYIAFIVPGLLVQNVLNGSYSNPSGSLFMSRQHANIEDFLLAPINYLPFTLAYVLAGIFRGATLGVGTLAIAAIMTDVGIHSYSVFFAFLVLISASFACFGVIVGLWAQDHQQLNIFTNFLVTPLTFLGGVFYSLDMVSPTLRFITQLNPIYYMVAGVRYGMLGFKEVPLWIGFSFLGSVTVALFVLAHYLVKTGYHLRT
mgnify:CR=1 FL=1